ncbi:MAG: hypothetical protein M3M94_05265 [Actinomycetota bacterium]|nr:hypothetical protein [Actinomycetota bacterium]
MAADLTLAAIPNVLDDDEVPFVLGFGPDSRRCLEAGGAQYRRGADRCTIDWKLDGVRLRAVLIEAGGNSYLMASLGPVLNEWWPLLQREGGNSTRPLLSAAVAGSAQTFRGSGLSVSVSISPPGPGVDMTTAVTGIQGGLTDDCLLLAHTQSLAVIKAALLMLKEYRTLVRSVPDVDVQAGGAALSLGTLLDVASDAADAITWTHSAG